MHAQRAAPEGPARLQPHPVHGVVVEGGGQRRTIMGSVSWCWPVGTAITSPAFSWSVLERRRWTSRPRSDAGADDVGAA